jgi:N-acetyl-anhydromuramyl-L-alanine amidase AmpD
MNQVTWDSLLALTRRLMSAYRIPIDRIVGHRERPSGRAQGKTCPGFDVAVVRDPPRQHG